MSWRLFLISNVLQLQKDTELNFVWVLPLPSLLRLWILDPKSIIITENIFAEVILKASRPNRGFQRLPSEVNLLNYRGWHIGFHYDCAIWIYDVELQCGFPFGIHDLDLRFGLTIWTYNLDLQWRCNSLHFFQILKVGNQGFDLLVNEVTNPLFQVQMFAVKQRNLQFQLINPPS